MDTLISQQPMHDITVSFWTFPGNAHIGYVAGCGLLLATHSQVTL